MHPTPPTDESYFRTLFEACGEAFFVANEQGQAIDCNDAALGLFACQRSDILGTTPLDWSPELQPNGRRSDEWAAEIFSSAATGETVRFEWENRRLDRSPVFVSVTVRRTTIDGQACYLIVSRNVTEQRRLEQQMAESEERFRAFFEQAPLPYQSLDMGANILQVNDAWLRLTGETDRAQVIGRSITDYLEETSLPTLAENFPRFVSSGEVEGPVFEMVSRDGAKHVVTVTGRIARDINGNPHHTHCILTDITERQRAEEALRASERRFSQLIQNSYDAIVILDAEGMQRYVSPSAERVHGYAPTELVDIPVIERMIHPDDQARVQAAFWQIIETGSGGAQYRHRKKSGGWVDLEAIGTNQLSNPDIRGVVVNVRDITERKLAEDQLRQAASVFEHANEGIVITDAKGSILDINAAFTRITGYARAEVLGRNPRLLSSGRQGPEFYAAMWQALNESGTWSGEIWNRRKTGEVFAELLTISAIKDEKGDVRRYVALFSDITTIKEHERQLIRLAHHDTLTDLPNRALLADRMRQAMARVKRNGHRMGVILLDLDGFKWINDSVGHDTGDAVLVTVARRLEGSVRAQDTVARLGGDEFVLVVQDVTNVDDVLLIAEKALGSLRASIEVGGRKYYVSGSAGITLYPDDGDDDQTLIRNADVAMYQAKTAGKNRCQYFAASMQTHALRRMETVSGLRQALLDKEFTLHYQPLVDAVTGRIDGAEALIRLQHPQLGMLPPAEFIPIAEESGLIVSIGAWALREALRQMRAWDDSGTPLPRMAVNFSAVQFREAGLCDMVSNALHELDLTPDRLTVEITESVLMDDNSATTASINGLQMLGVQIALDDFGTGYSSLSALKRFPVDYVKIDRSFVRDCIEDKEDANLVTAIIQMTHGLSLKVVAEGVETREQADLLRAHGCDQLQGYLISKPLPADAFTALLGKASVLSE